ncbi:RraA family protein [Dactylosporangium siamense]|uniref:Putative 4-hydroxy-4-methyl-2-oxoglutarate aldolase n=1 Tax=Dactylosporangium siamense TaxID=685454 RepID=A0A919PQU4_9ACTN|nr:RraA family protein [Dactylosporangium siamense]GIG48991.1 methyltransferase [Dactylosporangium siamense]
MSEHPDVIRRLAAEVDTTALCDAVDDLRVMSAALRCRSANPVLCGPARTVRCRDDFLGVIQALERAEPGDVLVVDGGRRETALAGEIFARVALSKGLAGIIIDGGYRDLRFVAMCQLPVYSRHVTPKAGTTVRPAATSNGVSCGGVPVHPGDIVIADHDGIVVLDPATAVAQLTRAKEVMAAEARVVERLDQGATLGELLNLAEHVERLTRGEPSRLRFTV